MCWHWNEKKNKLGYKKVANCFYRVNNVTEIFWQILSGKATLEKTDAIVVVGLVNLNKYQALIDSCTLAYEY